MILSEFAGAAQSLNGSIVVNPWDSQQVADAIHEAVTMDAETRAENNRKLFKVRLPSPPLLVCLLTYLHFALEQYVTKYSAAFWGTSFVREMSKIRPDDLSGDQGTQQELLQPAKLPGDMPAGMGTEEPQVVEGELDATVVAS